MTNTLKKLIGIGLVALLASSYVLHMVAMEADTSKAVTKMETVEQIAAFVNEQGRDSSSMLSVIPKDIRNLIVQAVQVEQMEQAYTKLMHDYHQDSINALQNLAFRDPVLHNEIIVQRLLSNINNGIFKRSPFYVWTACTANKPTLARILINQGCTIPSDEYACRDYPYQKTALECAYNYGWDKTHPDLVQLLGHTLPAKATYTAQSLAQSPIVQITGALTCYGLLAYCLWKCPSWIMYAKNFIGR